VGDVEEHAELLAGRRLRGRGGRLADDRLRRCGKRCACCDQNGRRGGNRDQK
jgi:hypothetical protein